MSAGRARVSRPLRLAIVVAWVLHATGAIDVNEGALSGRINAELGTKGVVVARGALTPGGTLRDPVLR